MSDRREQRQRERREKRVAKHAAKEDYKRHNAPSRIRGVNLPGSCARQSVVDVEAYFGAQFRNEGQPVAMPKVGVFD